MTPVEKENLERVRMWFKDFRNDEIVFPDSKRFIALNNIMWLIAEVERLNAKKEE